MTIRISASCTPPKISALIGQLAAECAAHGIEFSIAPDPAQAEALTPSQRSAFEGCPLVSHDGTAWLWSGSGALLDFFLGAVFCGDRVKDDTWVPGGGSLPRKLLSTLFPRQKNIGSARDHGLWSRPPRGALGMLK